MQKEDLMKLNFEGFKMQKCKIPTDRAQRVVRKNGVIWLVVIKMSKVTVFSVSYW